MEYSEDNFADSLVVSRLLFWWTVDLGQLHRFLKTLIRLVNDSFEFLCNCKIRNHNFVIA